MKFKHIGGGCRLNSNDGKQCDDGYQSEDGKIKFVVYTDLVGHTYLPESYELTKFSEFKIAEGKAIRQALKGGLTIPNNNPDNLLPKN